MLRPFSANGHFLKKATSTAYFASQDPSCKIFDVNLASASQDCQSLFPEDPNALLYLATSMPDINIRSKRIKWTGFALAKNQLPAMEATCNSLSFYLK